MGVVLVGVDGTPEAQAALMAGIEEARRLGSALLLVHHVRLSFEGDGVLRRREDGTALLEDAKARAIAAGIACETRLEIGTASAAEVLLSAASADAVDRIVIGTRKRSRVGKALLGSDAQQVVLRAGCPVLCVKEHEPFRAP